MCTWQMFSTWRGQATAPFSPVAAWTTPCACGMLPQVGRRSWWHMWISEKAVPWTAHHRRTPCSHLVESRCAWAWTHLHYTLCLLSNALEPAFASHCHTLAGLGHAQHGRIRLRWCTQGGKRPFSSTTTWSRASSGILLEPTSHLRHDRAHAVPRLQQRVVRSCTPRAAARRACPVAWSYLAGQLQCALTPARYVCA